MFALTLLCLPALAAPPEDGVELLLANRCTACHAPPASLASVVEMISRPATTLEDVGARLRVDWIEEHLGSGAHGPDLLGGWSEAQRADVAEALSDYLASRGGPFESVPATFDPTVLEHGRQLYHSVGCVACHAAFEVPEDLEAPVWSFTETLEPGELEPLPGHSLAHLPEKTDHRALAAYLRDPLAFRPDGLMPSLSLDPREARAIAQYLTTPEVRVDGPGFAHAPGLLVDYYEADEPNNPADVSQLLPTHSGTANDLASLDSLTGFERRDGRFALHYRGFVEVPADGMWRFASRSDDGSRVWIDGELVVNHWGDHPPSEKEGSLWLDAGRHTLEVSYYERGGGEELTVSWSGPGIPKAPIPAEALGHWTRATPAEPTADRAPERASEGRALFARLRCGACHELSGAPAPADARPLTELNASSGDGCLGDVPAAGLPRYTLSAEERGAIASALDDFPKAMAAYGRSWTPEATLDHVLDGLNCRACHERGGVGGPDDERAGYFLVKGDLDLGDEGRLPPALDHVGWKLKREALEGVLYRGEGVRPYMRTRMPQFGERTLAGLADTFAAVDGREETPRPEFDARNVELGRQLAGRAALGCVQCHDIAGYAGLGIPAADLAEMHDRLDYGWFRELLLHPQDIGMNSRMPYFFTDGKSPAVDVYGGDPERQVEALWTWLSMGGALPLPDGIAIDESEYDVVPTDGARLVGVFLQDASARGLMVGFPQRVHYAYDVENCSVRAVWRGAFLNAEGTWHGRAGKLEGPGSGDALWLSPGVPFSAAGWDEPWPTESARELGYEVVGRLHDRELGPTFRYTAPIGNEEIVVRETISPKVTEAGAALSRRMILTSDETTPTVTVRLAAGQEIEEVAERTYRVDGELELVVDGDCKCRIVKTGAGQELRGKVEVAPLGDITVEIRW